MRNPMFWLGMTAVVVLAGCQRGHPDYFGTVKPLHGPDELWTNNGNEPEWLDSGRMSDSAGSELVWNMFAGLVQSHPSTLEPMPDIARRWDITDNGATYTFHMRDGVVWSDGRPLTADDFVWSWKRVLDPTTGSKYASFLYVLKNGAAVNQRAVFVPNRTDVTVDASLVTKTTATDWPAPGLFLYVAGKTADDKREARETILTTLREQGVPARVADLGLVGATTTDDKTIVVRLEQPVPYFLYQLTFYTFLPVPRHVLERLEAEGKNPDLWTRAENIVTNGAYVMTEHKFRQYYTFEKNPLFWDADNVRLLRVKALLVDSYATGLNLYRAGEFDWSGGNSSLPNHYMDYLSKYKDFRRDPYLSVYMYWLNIEDPALRDPKFRKALSLAINRPSLIKNVTRAGQIPTADLVPDGLGGYKGIGAPVFDPVQARKLLDESSYDKSMKLALIYNTSEGHKKIATAVQQMWKDNLGIEVELENQEWKVFLKTRSLMNFQIARGGWIGDYPDPYTYLELLTAANGNNTSNWTNERYDRLLDEANGLQDPQARLDMFREAEKILLDESPIIPVYVYTRSQMVKPYVRGLWGNFQDRHEWKWMSIDERWYDGVPQAELADPPPDNYPFE